MSKPLLLDLFCSAGGAAWGYFLAGFEVRGVDINPQPNYPFDFEQGDALSYPLDGFDVYHASPPCQPFCSLTKHTYVDCVSSVRERLSATGKPYVIENVPNSPLINPIVLCGSAFGLNVRRHRLFESNLSLVSNGCNHAWQTPRFQSLDNTARVEGRLASVVGVHGSLNYRGEFELRCAAMGINWMTNKELTQAIPPAYTEFIGGQIMGWLG